MNPHSTNILVSGAQGLVGRALCDALRKRGYAVRTLSRSRGDVAWDTEKGFIDSNALNGIGCVIHLAGEPIAQRWSSEAKRRILNSRVKGTGMLAREILRHDRPVAFICASGVNYYGCDTPDPVTESSESGSGFLAEVCRGWEAAAAPLQQRGVRTVFLRTGVVLDAGGGALAKMLPPFRAGLGGRIGSGRQMMSWIALEDLVQIYLRAAEDEALCGAVNAVAPRAVSNAEFTQALGGALHRPTLLPVPAFLARTLFGEMAAETVLANLNVVPQRLTDAGFEWRHAGIDSALQLTIRSRACR
jgi:uncharacterized protein